MIGVIGAGSAAGPPVLAELERLGATARPAEATSLGWVDAVISLVPAMADVDAAVALRVPYVDASGDADFVAAVLERHAAAPVPVVPACGIEGLLGDLMGAVAAEHYGGPVDRVEVHLDDATRPVLALDRVLSPLLERVLLPRHVPGAEVVASFVRPVPHAFRAVAEATGMGPGTFVACEGRDPLAVSARLVALAAHIVSRPGQPPGAMAPAEAFDAERFLDAVAGPDLRWSFAFPETGDLTV